jgi:hypothetical protein
MRKENDALASIVFNPFERIGFSDRKCKGKTCTENTITPSTVSSLFGIDHLYNY